MLAAQCCGGDGDEECLARLASACGHVHPCGHLCCGVAGELEHLECLVCSDRADDLCSICYTEGLSRAPSLKLSNCTHVYHAHCLKGMLEAGYGGPRITFGFCTCPLCKAYMEHPSLEASLSAVTALRETV
jgi:E3 ubiquitin-protein ligase MYCBP2